MSLVMVVWALCPLPARLSTVSASHPRPKPACSRSPQVPLLPMAVALLGRLTCLADARQTSPQLSRRLLEGWECDWEAVEYVPHLLVQKEPDRDLSQQVSASMDDVYVSVIIYHQFFQIQYSGIGI